MQANNIDVKHFPPQTWAVSIGEPPIFLRKYPKIKIASIYKQ